MGNSQTSASKETNPTSDPKVVAFSALLTGSSTNAIQKQAFLERITPPFLAHALWKRYSRNDEIDTNDFAKMVDELTEIRDKINYFENLILSSSIQESDALKFLSLFFPHVSQSNECVISIWEAYKQYSANDSDQLYNKADFGVWISRNFPDLAEDVHSSILTTISSGEQTKPDTNILASKTENTLLNPDVGCVLSFCLPAAFKRPFSHSSLSMASYELEKISGWTCLFNSLNDGVSASRFIDAVFGYCGGIVMLLKTPDELFCLACDEALKEDFQTFGGPDSRFYQLLPKFSKFVSGTAKSTTGKQTNGIIYCHFTAKSGRRGIFVGHQPLERPVVEMDEGMNKITVIGRELKLEKFEVWATGDADSLKKHEQRRLWDKQQVEKNKNRKLKMEDWADSPDRHILSMGGVNVRNAERAGEKKGEN